MLAAADQRTPALPIVGIGASAGGVEALKAFFEATPADSGLAFVVILHMSPEHTSLLAEVLRRHARIAVDEVREGVPVEPNHVYVIAPGKYVTVGGGRLHLETPASADRPRAPVDAFFRSLAAEQQDRAIGVVLSGTGSNGTLGLREIKAHGGLALAQDPETCPYPSMARSAINAGIIDFVLPVREMPAKLVELAVRWDEHRPEAAPPQESDLQTIVRLVRSRTAYDFSHYKPGTLHRRIARRMTVRGVQSSRDYVELLRSEPEEAQTLFRDLLIRVTNFFREPLAFEALSEHVIPDLVRHSEDNGAIRVWVPGCATGEEAYSIAMLLFDRLAVERRTADVKVFASDVDHEAIEIGRTGCYPESIAEDVTDDMLRRYFVLRDGGFHVAKHIRDAVVFAVQNALDDPPFSRMDLISCRNLLIYLQPEAQRRALGLFHFGLREGGWLFLGNAETVGDQQDIFAPVSRKQRIFRRLGPTRHDRLEFPAGAWEPKLYDFSPPPPPPRSRQEHVAVWAGRLLVERYAPACVIVNREFEILYFSGVTHEYLVQPMGSPSHDLLAMAREGLGDTLRALVKRAIDEEHPATTSGEVLRGGEYFPVRCMAVPLRAPRAAEGLLLVSFEDQTRVSASAEGGDGDREQPRLQQLEYELAITREDLQAAIERLESSNEEYKAANEEVRSMNEELQSVNEELETSKEELQSLNEELTSVNHQLEGKVAELEATTDDLQNLLRSTDIATLFLDRQLCIRRFTPAVTKLMNLIPGDIGRPLSDIARKFTDDMLLDDARTVLEKLVPREAEISTPGVSWFIRRILPYRTEDDHIDGVVITFTEITGRKRAEQELSELARSLERKVDQRTRLVRLLQDVAIISNEAESVEKAVKMTLERVCTQFGWPAGHAFLRDEDEPHRLVDSNLWYLQSPDALAGLVEARRDVELRPGEEAAGRAAETAQPVWVHDVQHETASLRGFTTSGGRIRGAFAFPVLSGANVVGVLEFFVTGDGAPDPDVIPGMREIGTQLGRVIERARLEHEVADATAHEQRFVGQELHDTITQDIAGVRMLLTGLTQDLEAAGSSLAEKARTSAQHLEATAQRVRQLAHGMMPAEIAPDALDAALQTLVGSCRDLHGMPIQCDCRPVRVKSSVTAMHLYRIAQEAVNNAVRHATATQVSISLSSTDGQGSLIIQDDGSGFEADESQPGGVGMQIMRYRANMIGANLKIQSRPAGGTRIECSFPCAKW